MMGASFIEDTYLTEKELAERLKVSVSKLQKDRVKGTGVPFTIVGGKSVRYSARAVSEYLSKSTYQSTTAVSEGVQ
jgi:hypothetical protein